MKKMAVIAGVGVLLAFPVAAQLVDQTLAPNVAKAGINKSLAGEIGAGRGDVMTANSSAYIINRDPFRSIRRGRQLFQRKFTMADGVGPILGDGSGDINTDGGFGAGLSDSCALCHGRPRGSAGAGGNVATRPDSRDAPHLFGLGLKEMLGDEMTQDLRAIQAQALALARATGTPVTKPLKTKGVSFGSITGNPNGTVDTSQVQGVDADLRIRPFFAQGATISMREFIVGALFHEMGLTAVDPDLAAASSGQRVVTPSGMVLDGSLDKIEAPPAPDPQHGNEIDTALVDHLEFYLLNYFKPALGKQDAQTQYGKFLLAKIGCNFCHVADLTVNKDRRVADLNTVYDPVNGNFNSLFGTATALINAIDDGSGLPTLKQPKGNPFLVRNIYSDFKRHDVGPGFYERNYDGSLQTQFVTRPLWGVGSTAPYGHDGRSMTLDDVIRRHGGEAQASANAYASLTRGGQTAINAFLNSLMLFPPDDTASNLDPGNRSATNFPQFGHGSVKLTVLFNDPTDVE